MHGTCTEIMWFIGLPLKSPNEVCLIIYLNSVSGGNITLRVNFVGHETPKGQNRNM